ncbi:unnamed protein product [Durusdinium trenchii]|uniref:Uncharacterized protein n=1 Tax=Durusdinium trenchii TaxID=1381693 RepID=A0ABP0J0X0_9DINO
MEQKQHLLSPGEEIVAILLQPSWMTEMESEGSLWQKAIDIPDQEGIHDLVSLEWRKATGVSEKLHFKESKDHNNTITRRIELGPEEWVVGFKMHETCEEAGAKSFRNVEVFIGGPSGYRLEPLARGLVVPEPAFPGKITWLPEQAEPSRAPTDCRITGLRSMRGTGRDHLVGIVFDSTNSWNPMWICRGLTGEAPMFWLDLLVLTCLLSYLDLFSDVQQFRLFYRKGLLGYLMANVCGICVPILFTCRENYLWAKREPASPQLEFLQTLIPSGYTTLLPCLAVICTALQLHILLLTLMSAYFRQKFSALVEGQQGEVTEAAISALVQLHLLMNVLVEVDQFESLDMTADEIHSLSTSIGLSLLSLGFSFASRDKAPTPVLGLPGTAGWGPIMVTLIILRTMEVTGRLAAINLVHISTRGSTESTSMGGPSLVLFLLFCASMNFPEARGIDLLAAIAAHPGQVLQPASLLPLWKSIVLQLMVTTLATSLQYLLRRYPERYLETFPGAKEVPLHLAAPLLAASACSMLLLPCLAFTGSVRHHPLLHQLSRAARDASGENLPKRHLLYSVVAATLNHSKPCRAALQVMAAEGYILDLDDAALKTWIEGSVGELQAIKKDLSILTTSGSGPFLQCNCLRGFLEREELLNPEFCENFMTCFKEQSMANRVLDLSGCKHISPRAWAVLSTAHWPHLQIVYLWCCWQDSEDGCGDMFQCLSRCERLEEIYLGFCKKISKLSWDVLKSAHWPELRTGLFWHCFEESGEGAEVLLSMLSRSQKLRSLDFRQCPALSDTVWDVVPTGSWPKLTQAHGIPGIVYDQLRGTVTQEPERWHDSFEVEGKDVAEQPDTCIPSFCVVDVFGCLEAPPAPSDLPHGLQWAKVMYAPHATNPLNANEWAKVAAKFLASKQTLQRVDCMCCFNDNGAGSDELLKALCQCEALEELIPLACGKIHVSAWRMLAAARWPRLRRVSFDRCFGESSEGSEEVLSAIKHCSVLEDVDFINCEAMPGEAWDAVPTGAWPLLKKVQGIPAEVANRLRGECRNIIYSM